MFLPHFYHTFTTHRTLIVARGPKGGRPVVMDNPNFYSSPALRRVAILSLLHPRPSGARTLHHGPSGVRTARP